MKARPPRLAEPGSSGVIRNARRMRSPGAGPRADRAAAVIHLRLLGCKKPRRPEGRARGIGGPARKRQGTTAGDTICARKSPMRKLGRRRLPLYPQQVDYWAKKKPPSFGAEAVGG